MKVIFMGTPDFAVPSLEMLIENHNVIAVVTQPDRPKGRGKKMIFSAVKEKAIEQGIPVYQPEKVRDEEFINIIKSLEPDIIVVVAFGQILPESILNIPQYGCVNVHGSLLPKYRGAAPIQWSVINGEEITGVTTMYMAKGLDSGDMLIKARIPLVQGETYGSLHDKMAPIGAETLKKTLEGLENGTLKGEVQNHDLATYAPMIEKETGHIDWNKSSQEIISLINGMNPVPGAFCVYEEESLKIWAAEKAEGDYEGFKNGEITEVSKKGFSVKTGDGVLMIKQVQAKGGKSMSADAYMRGHEIKKGIILQ